MLLEALVTIARKWRQPNSPTGDEWIKKVWYINTVVYCTVIRKRKLIFPDQATAPTGKSMSQGLGTMCMGGAWPGVGHLNLLKTSERQDLWPWGMESIDVWSDLRDHAAQSGHLHC